MTKTYDLDEVARAVRASFDIADAKIPEKDQEAFAAQSRMVEIHVATAVWFFGELNRGTPVGDIVSLLAAATAGTVLNIANGDDEEFSTIATGFITSFMARVSQTLTGEGVTISSTDLNSHPVN